MDNNGIYINNCIYIYAIGGKWNPGPSGDQFVGCAYDATTALSLLDLVESKGGYAVSLHGNDLHMQSLNAISGECGVREARIMFTLWDSK
jgi:hypothetical protein